MSQSSGSLPAFVWKISSTVSSQTISSTMRAGSGSVFSRGGRFLPRRGLFAARRNSDGHFLDAGAGDLVRHAKDAKNAKVKRELIHVKERQVVAFR